LIKYRQNLQKMYVQVYVTFVLSRDVIPWLSKLLRIWLLFTIDFLKGFNTIIHVVVRNGLQSELCLKFVVNSSATDAVCKFTQRRPVWGSITCKVHRRVNGENTIEISCSRIYRIPYFKTIKWLLLRGSFYFPNDGRTGTELECEKIWQSSTGLPWRCKDWGFAHLQWHKLITYRS